MAYCIHTLLLKDALSIFTVLVEQNYTFTLRKSEENLYSFYVTLVASWTHILLLKDALSILTLLVEQDYTFTLRKSEENLLTFYLKLLAFSIHVLFLKDTLSIFTLLVKQKYRYFNFQEIWRIVFLIPFEIYTFTSSKT